MRTDNSLWHSTSLLSSASRSTCGETRAGLRVETSFILERRCGCHLDDAQHPTIPEEWARPGHTAGAQRA